MCESPCCSGALLIGARMANRVCFGYCLCVSCAVGPFINDALAGMWKAGAGEFSQLQEFCTSQKQEIEADVVSVR